MTLTKNHFRKVFIIGTVIFLIERLISGGFNAPFKNLILVFFIFQLYSFVISLANIYFFSKLENKISWLDQPKKRLLIGSIGSFLITMFCITILRYITVVVFFQNSWEEFLNTSSFYYIFSLIATANVIIIYHAIYFFKAMTENKIAKHQAISKTETAKFESLKNQLDPHFLFNSLNVLTALIEENPKQAEKFTTKLSKIYRYVLQQKSQDLIEVNQELSFAKTYMDLLKIRFEDSIDFIITDNLEEQLKIVPLSLQLLLENAVKHNEISTKKQLKITIYKEDNYLIIENNLSPKKSLVKSTKIGLNNIQERYALITKLPIVIEKTNKTFKVKLPLLTKKTIMKETYNKEEKYYQAKKQN